LRDVEEWLRGDPAQPPPPPQERKHGRNSDWKHLNAAEVISMPDKWEYPWFAAWDLAFHWFHCVALAHIDPEFMIGMGLSHQRLARLIVEPNQPNFENPPVQPFQAAAKTP
jgi:hypothetical protein